MQKTIQSFRKTKKELTLTLILLLLFQLPLISGIIEKTYTFTDPVIYDKDNYQYLEMNECFHIEIPAKPKLPAKVVKLLLPPGEKAVKVWVNGHNLTAIAGQHFVYPTQYERIVSDYNYNFTEPDMQVYNSNANYPEEIHSNFNTQYFRGHSIVVLEIYPCVYQPGLKKLSYYKEISVKVETSGSSESNQSYQNLYRGDEKTRTRVQEMAHNTTAISKYPAESGSKAYYETDYLIITTNAFEDDFDEFVKFKKLQGYNTEVVTVEDIYSSYYGYDNQDKIRLCIRDYYQNHGTDYVLLGGDTENIPHRGLFGHFWLNADPDPIHTSDDDMPADLYYAGLDRVGSGSGPDWNVDDDSMWGEVDVGDPMYGDITEADFTMEVYIGRICADSHTEFANALNKQIMYQKDPVTSDNKKSIMVGQKMWVGYCGDEAKEEVRLGGTYDGYTTAGFEDGGFVSQLQYACDYTPDTAWPVQHLIDKMNAGASILNHLGHGNVRSWMNFYTQDGTVDLLTSDGINHNFHMIYSQTCYGASFDNRYPGGTYTTDCLTEEFTTHENGVFAVVGNSRYGLTGVGQRNDRYFFDAIFKASNPTKKLGEMLAYSKDQTQYNSDARRWQNYELNLFGDPALELWTTNAPDAVWSAAIISSINVGISEVTVQVAPGVAGLRVSVMTDNSDALFGTALTNGAGIAVISLNHSMNQEATVFGMVTGEDVLPYEFAGGQFVPGAWTGAVSTSWHDAGNWASSLIPDATSDVIIPNGCTNYPVVHYPAAACNNLEIEGNASLTISNTQLTVDDDITIFGELKMTSISSGLVVNGSISWENNSTADISNSSAEIEVFDHWIFNNGSNVHLDKGTVKCSGTNKGIKCYSSNSYFNHLIINAAVNKYIYYSSSSTEDLIIKGDLEVNPGATFRHYSPLKTIVDGDFINDGHHYFSEGTFVFNGAGMSFYSSTSSMFNNLEINSTGTIEFMTGVEIDENLVINSGSLNPSGNSIWLGGDWEDNVGAAGFDGSSGTVIFNGSSDQYILTDEDFNLIKLQKSGGSLVIDDPNIEVNCNEYDWMFGTITMHSGEFTAWDLTDDGIFGNYFMDGGTITVMNFDGFVDLNCDLTIEGGFFNVYGGTVDSYWPFSANANLTMSGGVLDFKDQGIFIYDSPTYYFNENITGGKIRTTGSFSGDDDSFNPPGGILELYGPNDVYLGQGPFCTFRDLEINKSTVKNAWPYSKPKPLITCTGQLPANRATTKNTSIKSGSKSNQVSVTTDLDINESLEINSGNFVMYGHNVDVAEQLRVYGNLTMTDPNDYLTVHDHIKWETGATASITEGIIAFEGAWYFKDGSDVQISTGNQAIAYGETNQNLNNNDDNSHFGNLMINKADISDVVSSAGSDPVRVAGDLELTSSSYLKLQGDEFIISGDVTTHSNTLIEVQQNSYFTAENDMTLNGMMHMISGDVEVQNDLHLNSFGVLVIDDGTFTVSKPTGSEYQSFDGSCEINGGLLDITFNGLKVNSGGLLTMTGGELQLCYSFNIINPNTFQPTGGGVKFKGSGFASIIIDATNYFHDFTIHKPSTQVMNMGQPILVNNDFHISAGKFQTLENDLTIMGHLTIGTAGELDPDNGYVYVGGDWTNNRGVLGFKQGNSTVSFFGYEYSNLFENETFYNLEVDKVGKYNYIWIDTAIVCNVSNDVSLIGASLRLRENSVLNIDGDLIINDSTNLFTPNHVESYINITGDWINHNTSGYPWAYGFVHGLSTVTFEGDGDNFVTCDHGLQDFYNLNIDKTANAFHPGGDITVINDLTITDGEWAQEYPGYNFTILGDITIEAGGYFAGDYSTFTIAGEGAQTLTSYSGIPTEINNLYIDMSEETGENTPVFSILGNLLCNGNIVVDTGEFFVNSSTLECEGNILINDNGIVTAPYNSTISMGPGSMINVTGELNMTGDGTNNPTLTSISGYYEFNIINGGLLATSNAVFENMNIEGIAVYATGSVYGTNAFSNCIFRNGEPGGKLLTINNDQDLIINGADFPANTWGGTYNVAKYSNQGSLSFTNTTGSFAGDSYEDDPYNRISWDLLIPGIWTGAVNHTWNYSGNWKDNLKPTASDDVYIPAGTPNDPWVASTDQECNNITIEAGAKLRIYDEILTVHGDMIIYGELEMDNSSGVLNAGDGFGDIISWEAGSSDDITYGTINVFGDWYFKSGTNAQLGSGNTVNFYGGNRSFIYCDDIDASFGNLEINKTGIPKDYVHLPAGNSLRVLEDLYVFYGTLELNENTYVNVGNEFYIESGCTLSAVGQVGSEITISGYPNYCVLEINNGATISAEYATFEYIEYGGVAINPTATIDPAHPFNYCTFRESPVGGTLLTIANSQTLTIDGAVFPPNYWSGGYNVNKQNNDGQITFTNVEGGFVGPNYEDDPYNRVHWPGVSAGVWTGASNTLWNVLENWEYMLKPTATTEVIIPSGCTNYPRITLSDQECRDIEIEPGASLEICDKTFTVYDHMIIGGELIMNDNAGILNAGDEFGDNISWGIGSTANLTTGTINVYGNWYFHNGTNAQLSGINSVVFYGNNSSTIYCTDDDASFAYLTINKTSSTHNIVTAPASNSVRVAEDFYLGDGVFEINEGSLFKVGNEIIVDNGGTFRSLGTATNNATVSGAPNYCLFEIANGGTISAEYTIFEYLEYAGLAVNPGSTIDPLRPLNYCTFRESPAGGWLLTIANNQVLTIDGAKFPANTWGGGYNVQKFNDDGHITLSNVEGEFVGSAYEDDQYDRLDWPGVVPGIWTGLVSPFWNVAGNWAWNMKPEAEDDVYIPNDTPYYPWVSQANHECNNILIEDNTLLRVYNKTLTVHGNMTIHGQLIMDNSAGELNVGAGYGDYISWEPGSSSNIISGSINVYGDWYFQNGTNATLGTGNLVNFCGNNISNIYCYDADAAFGNLSVNKSAHPHDLVNISSFNTIRVAEDLAVGDGELKLNNGSKLYVGNEFNIKDGCTLTAIGTPSRNALISGYPNHCVLDIASGGTIGAEYATFEFLEYYGVTVNSGATINPDYPFNNCTFRESSPFGSLLTINNDQNITIDGAHFETNTWSGDYNVSKTVDEGHLTFTNATGDFAGEVHEYDVYNRIDWFRPWYDLNLRVFLEGPFNTTLMNTNLSSSIPMTQPYNVQPWNYDGNESVLSIPDKAVDWVLIELRDASGVASATSGTIIDRRAAFIKNNGYILDLDGLQSLKFNKFIHDELYVVIWHRNHVGVISANALLEAGGAYTYDFTISEDRAWGDDDAHKEIAPSVWGMAAGNSIHDDIIDLDDYIQWRSEAGEKGYKLGDFNLDTQINNKDKNDSWYHNRGRECWIPF